MGPKVLVRDLAILNFDKVVYVVLAIIGKFGRFIIPEIVAEGPYDIDADALDRRQWLYGRSMTEEYALQEKLGVAAAQDTSLNESFMPGLPGLCQALAENNGRVPGVQGGQLCKLDLPEIARNLWLLHRSAAYPAGQLFGALAEAAYRALCFHHPLEVLQMKAQEGFWSDIRGHLRAAEHGVYSRCYELVRNLQTHGNSSNACLFHLWASDGQSFTVGIHLTTESPNEPKHLWAACRRLGAPAALMIVAHPSGSRFTLLTSRDYRVDLRRVQEALAITFGGRIELKSDLNLIAWIRDPDDERVPSFCNDVADEIRRVVTQYVVVAEVPQVKKVPQTNEHPAHQGNLAVSIGERLQAQ